MIGSREHRNRRCRPAAQPAPGSTGTHSPPGAPGEQGWYLPVAFTVKRDGRAYLSDGARGTPKIA